ncbi:ATP-binding protein [Sporomusa paucivorans]|uniref:ATP-binding protein n=1 Tax=Sporomusa paucivorans TaxID=2376 RepID=UPI00357132CA
MVEFVNMDGLNLTTDDIPDYFDIIDQAVKSDLNCRGCSGLQKCKSEAEGMMYVLEVAPTGKISPSYRMCRYKVVDMESKRISRLLASSRLPDFFQDKTFDNFKRHDNGEAYMAAQRAANDVGGLGVMLYGKPGTGKTHLAAAIVNARLASGNQAVFVTVPELLSDIRDTIGRGDDTSELLDIVKSVDLLVMDDMGTERMTAWVCEQLFSVVNARLMRKKQTVVTTNYTPSELIARMAIRDRHGNIDDDLPGKRIVSRLTEMCQKVELRGKDQRLGSVG